MEERLPVIQLEASNNTVLVAATDQVLVCLHFLLRG